MLSHSSNETATFAKEVCEGMKPHDARATVLLLTGDLGSGKTTFTQSIAQCLGVSQHVVSPTFVIEKRYALDGSHGFDMLIHIDAYRLEGIADHGVLRLDETLGLARTLVVVEWPELLTNHLPPTATQVRFTHEGGDVRRIDILPRT